MADSTLDEIIKQKRMKRFNTGKQQNKGGNQKNVPRAQQQKGGQGKAMMNKKGRLFKEVQRDLGIKTKKPLSINTDARNKIIQKQRIKFTDARDRLAQIAKQGDARDKINKIRKGRPGEKVVPQLKKTVVKKKIVNVPRQTFVKSRLDAARVNSEYEFDEVNVGQTRVKGNAPAGQTRVKGNAVIRTVAGADPLRKKKFIVKGKPGPGKKTAIITKGNRDTRRNRPIPNNPGVFTIKNNHPQAYDTTYEVVDYRPEIQLGPRAHGFAGGMGVTSHIDDLMSMRTEPVMRTRPAETVVYAREYEPEVRPSRLRITAANSNYRVGGQQQQQYSEQWQQQAWTPPARMQQRKREYYDDQVEYQVYPKRITTVAAPQVQTESGTKVVVSNLHPCVSVEDMEELFGTIGAVLSVRMVRQGVAEAMFVNQDDAYRSVELFNNRQLDGQPMKVMVVRKKQVANSNVQARSVLKNARGRSGYYVQ